MAGIAYYDVRHEQRNMIGVSDQVGIACEFGEYLAVRRRVWWVCGQGMASAKSFVRIQRLNL